MSVEDPLAEGGEAPFVPAADLSFAAMFSIARAHEIPMRQLLDDLDDVTFSGRALPEEGLELYTAVRVVLAAYCPGRSS
jgi:hypothetical protein